MKIWRLAADVNQYANFTSQPKLTHEQRQSFDGRSKITNWKPLELQRIDGDIFPVGDAVGFDMGFLVSKKAMCLFSDVCSDTIEFLPMYYGDTEYYIPNVLGVVDCLDRQKSKCLYSRSSKDRVLMVNKYAFNEDLIAGKCVFRVKDEPFRGPFVTEKMVSAIRASSLSGFCFDLVWDNNETEERKVSFDGVILREY